MTDYEFHRLASKVLKVGTALVILTVLLFMTGIILTVLLWLVQLAMQLAVAP